MEAMKTFIARGQVARELSNPNGISVKLYKLCCKVKAVLLRLYLFILTCLYYGTACTIKNFLFFEGASKIVHTRKEVPTAFSHGAQLLIADPKVELAVRHCRN